MKIIILGAGKRGLRLARRLSEENKDVVIIDNDDNLVKTAMSNIDCIAYSGSGTSLENLSDAGMESADAFVALTGDDEVNIVSSAMVSHEFQVPMTIASIRNISYTGSSGSNSNLLGITHIVNTDYEVAADIYDEIERGVFSDVISFHDSKLVIYNMVIGANPEFCDISVMELRRRIGMECLAVAIYRDNATMIPSGSTIINKGDTVSIVLRPEDSSRALKITGKPKVKPKRIAIVGATHISRLLLKMFSEKERGRFAIVERDPQLCDEFAREFPEVLIINGNITDEYIFKDEDLGAYDLMITLTESDELNIIIASYCKRIGVGYSMAVVRSNNNYLRLARHMGIDSIVSAQEVTVDSITRFLHGANVNSVHSLFDAKIEVFEYVITAGSGAIGKKLKQFNMQSRGIVAGVTDSSQNTIIPNGEYEFKEGDILVLIMKQESSLAVMRMFD